MGILSNIEKYITENNIIENYNLTPIDYEEGVNVSFEIDYNGEKVADVKIVKKDGKPVDAVNDTYDFSDVYADVIIDIEGKEDTFDIMTIKKWIMSKLIEMGYNKNPAIVDGEEVEFSEGEEDEKKDDFAKVKKDVEDFDSEKSFSLDDLEMEEI